jgi:dTDP-4-dehydrorhamnose 3,5-epimerase
MRRLPYELEGPVLLQPVVHRDGRGFFLETYRRSALAELGIDDEFVQDNHSRSAAGVVRGMHFAAGPGQAKLVRCARGAVWDVLVDLRVGSPSFGRWAAAVLDDVDLRMIYVPVGFAHGFCVTSDVADVVYACSAYFDPAAERGFAPGDPDVAIPWPVEAPTVSARDASAPLLREIAADLPFAYPGPGPRATAIRQSAR